MLGRPRRVGLTGLEAKPIPRSRPTRVSSTPGETFNPRQLQDFLCLFVDPGGQANTRFQLAQAEHPKLRHPRRVGLTGLEAKQIDPDPSPLRSPAPQVKP